RGPCRRRPRSIRGRSDARVAGRPRRGGRGGRGRSRAAAVRRSGTALLALALACTRSAADHEVLGDREYAAGAYRNALAEYQLGLRANPSADLHAKLASAAFHTGDHALAAAEYVALAAADRSRAGEAADGLERVAGAAL